MATVDGKLRPPLGLNEYNHALADSADFFGINYYTRDLVRFHPGPAPTLWRGALPPGRANTPTADGAGIYSEYAPEGLYQICAR